MSFGLLNRLSWNLSARTVRVPSSATRDTQRPPCSAARMRPWRSRVRPFDCPVAKVVSSGPSGRRRQRAMRLFGISLKSSAPPRHTGPSVKPSPPATRSIAASGAMRSCNPGLRTFQDRHGFSSPRSPGSASRASPCRCGVAAGMSALRISKPLVNRIAAFERKTVVTPNAAPTLPKTIGTTRCVALRTVFCSPKDSAMRPAGVKQIEQRHRHRLGAADAQPEQERNRRPARTDCRRTAAA